MIYLRPSISHTVGILFVGHGPNLLYVALPGKALALLSLRLTRRCNCCRRLCREKETRRSRWERKRTPSAWCRIRWVNRKSANRGYLGHNISMLNSGPFRTLRASSFGRLIPRHRACYVLRGVPLPGGGHQDQVGGLLGGVKICSTTANLPLQVLKTAGEIEIFQ